MPLDTETYDLAAERDRLRETMDAKIDERLEYEDQLRTAVENDSNSTEYIQEQMRRVSVRGGELDNYAAILDDLIAGEIPTLPATESLVFTGLATGDVNLVEDIAADAQAIRERDVWVAVGTVDAPWLEHDPDAYTPDDVRETVERVVSDCPLSLVRWAEEEISDLSYLSEATGNGFLTSLREKRQKRMQEATNG